MKESPNSAERHAYLGLLYAFLGRKDDAIREGRRAVELKPESADAYDGADERNESENAGTHEGLTVAGVFTVKRVPRGSP